MRSIYIAQILLLNSTNYTTQQNSATDDIFIMFSKVIWSNEVLTSRATSKQNSCCLPTETKSQHICKSSVISKPPTFRCRILPSRHRQILLLLSFLPGFPIHSTVILSRLSFRGQVLCFLNMYYIFSSSSRFVSILANKPKFPSKL